MKKTTVGHYLIKRLEQAGIKHLFGVPGDYVLDFMDLVVESNIALIGNCNELNAGYAADAYARLNGIGAACVTYGVGGLSTLNSAAGAYAEQVPVVYISGAPSSTQRLSNTHMHHTVTSYSMQWDIFRNITVDSVQLTNAHGAPDEIDRVLSNCVSERQPVYIEIPVDMVATPCRPPAPLEFLHAHTSEPDTLAECVQETMSLLDGARYPVILAGVEVHRFGLADKLLRLVEKLDIPFATTIDGKSVLPEKHPLFIGIYMGALSRKEVREQLENSDGLLSIGSMTTDINSGGFTAHLPQHRMISAHKNRVRIGRHYYDRVWLGDYLDALSRALKPHNYTATHHIDPHGPGGEYQASPDAPVRVSRFYDRLNRFLGSEMILVAETGDAMFAASELYVNEPENFVSQAYYLSIGYALPATLGLCLARPDKRVVLLQGDGSFQMTVQELSTLLHYNCHPVIFLLNNDGYVIERLIHDGPYNDIPQWNYHLLPHAFGGKALCYEVKTEGELEHALDNAGRNQDKLVFINLHLPPDEGSAALQRLCTELRKLQTGD